MKKWKNSTLTVFDLKNHTPYQIWLRLFGVYFFFVNLFKIPLSSLFFSIYKEARATGSFELYFILPRFFEALPSEAAPIIQFFGMLGSLGLIFLIRPSVSALIVFLTNLIEQSLLFNFMTPEYKMVNFCLLMVCIMPNQKSLFSQGVKIAWLMISLTFLSFAWAKLNHPLWQQGLAFHHIRINDAFIRDFMSLPKNSSASLFSLIINYAVILVQAGLFFGFLFKKIRWYAWLGTFSFTFFIPIFFSMTHTGFGASIALLMLLAMSLSLPLNEKSHFEV